MIELNEISLFYVSTFIPTFILKEREAPEKSTIFTSVIKIECIWINMLWQDLFSISL